MMDRNTIASLEELRQKLADAVQHVSIRGLAGGPFLFAKNGGRSVEVSTNDGRWWMEVWEASDDEDALPVAEYACECEEDVLRRVREWLISNA